MMKDSQSNKQRLRVLVIGAGAAGLAAGRRLTKAGFEVVLLEARDRVGGRAWTNDELAAHPVERGAEWVASDTVVTNSLMREFGLQAMHDQNWEQFGAFVNGRLLGVEEFMAQPQAKEIMTLSMVDRAVEAWTESGRPDASLAEAWNLEALEPSMRTLLRHRILIDASAEPELLGVDGWWESETTLDESRFFRIAEGHGSLMECLAKGQDIQLETPIERVEWNEAGVTAHTRSGDCVDADFAVVTLPLGVLQAGDVTFEPSLPAAKRAAITGLGSATVTKLILRFSNSFWPDDVASWMTILDTQAWYRPGGGRANEEPILIGYVGGTAAQRLAALGLEGATREALRQLEQMFGVENLESRLESAEMVAWGNDPYSKMAYSYVPVGGCGLRDQLAAPVGRLFFAGEATNRDHAGYVHGALESGFRAADEIIEIARDGSASCSSR